MSNPNRIHNIPGKPEKAADYDLGQGKFGRVIYTILSNDGNTMRVEVQAFEVNPQGAFMSAPNGAPSRTKGQITEVHLSGVVGPLPTQTLKAGWVFQPPTGGQVYDMLNPPPHDFEGSGSPSSDLLGTVGQYYWDLMDGRLWKWHPGAIESVIQDKAIELQTLIANSDILNDFTL